MSWALVHRGLLHGRGDYSAEHRGDKGGSLKWSRAGKQLTNSKLPKAAHVAVTGSHS